MLTHPLMVHIGQFSKAGLHEWMPFIIFHTKSRKRSQLALLGGHCFMLCITMEVEPRIMEQYKCQYCCICKNYWEKVMEKHLFIIFWLTRRLWVRVKNTHLAYYSTSNKLLLPDTFWQWAFKNVFQVGTVNFTNSLSLPSTVKKVCTGSNSGQGT